MVTSGGDLSFSCVQGDGHWEAQHDGPNQLKKALEPAIACLDRSAGHLNAEDDRALWRPEDDDHSCFWPR